MLDKGKLVIGKALYQGFPYRPTKAPIVAYILCSCEGKLWGLVQFQVVLIGAYNVIAK